MENFMRKAIASTLDELVKSKDEIEALTKIAESKVLRYKEEMYMNLRRGFTFGGLFLLLHYSQIRPEKLLGVEFSNLDVPYLILFILTNIYFYRFIEICAEDNKNHAILAWCRRRQFSKLTSAGNIVLVDGNVEEVYNKLYPSRGVWGALRNRSCTLRGLLPSVALYLFPFYSCYAVWGSNRFGWLVCTLVTIGIIYLFTLMLIQLSYSFCFMDEPRSLEGTR